MARVRAREVGGRAVVSVVKWLKQLDGVDNVIIVTQLVCRDIVYLYLNLREDYPIFLRNLKTYLWLS